MSTDSLSETTNAPRSRWKSFSAVAMVSRSEVAFARFTSLKVAENALRLVHSRLPLLISDTRQPLVSCARRKSTWIDDSITAEDSVPSGRSSDERSEERRVGKEGR